MHPHKDKKKFQKDWFRIQVDSRNIHYTKRNAPPHPVHINNEQLPQEGVKYLGLHLNRRLTCTKHFRKTETARNPPHQNVLVTRTQIKTLHKQQTSHTSNNTQTNLDLRNTTVGYGFHFQQILERF
jgi:hypothetical protein